METLGYNNAKYFLKINFEVNHDYNLWDLDINVVKREETHIDFFNRLDGIDNFDPNINDEYFILNYIPLPNFIGRKPKTIKKYFNKFLNEKIKEFVNLHKVKGRVDNEYYDALISYQYGTTYIIKNPLAWIEKIKDVLAKLI
jgi:hypothetical protein